MGVTPSKIKIGTSVALSAELVSTHRRVQPVVVDYVVHYQRKSGTGAKVFKWKTLDLAGNSRVSLQKKHAMKRTTIRALYPGVHRVSLQVNGVVLAETSFELLGS